MTNPAHCLNDFYQILDRHPKHLAFKDHQHALSYQDLNNHCAAMATQFRALGIRRKQRVLMLCDQSTAQIILYYTLLTLGCTVVLHMPIKHHTDWCFILDDIEPHWVLSQYHPAKKKWTKKIYTFSNKKGHLTSSTAIEPTENPAQDSLTNHLCQTTTADDLAMIIYTSGSSAKPKGVMLTHRNLRAARNSITSYLNMHHEHVVLSTLPFWFDYGLYQSYLCFSVGASLIQTNNRLCHQTLFDYLEKNAVNFMPLTPNLIQIIEQKCLAFITSFPKVQTITSTGSPLYQQHVLALQKMFPNADIYAMYGLTECKRCAYLPPHQLKHIANTTQIMPLGIAIPNTCMTIIDRHHQTITQANQTGEIIIQGEHVMAGYWRRPEINANTVKAHPLTGQRTLYTGDLAYLNNDGQLCHIGRKDDVFKCKGIRISPRYIEAHLCHAFAIHDIYVFGMPVAHGDHQIVVHLHVANHIDEDTLQLFCRAHLEPCYQPSMWCFRSALPKLSNGKIDAKTIVIQHHQMHLSQRKT
jgi:acyl-CoA synthetase (AMP-forming)/AMP-acid ligase II